MFPIESDVNPEEDLKKTLSGLIEYLFKDHQYRFNNDYFPFTNPSFEVEVLFNDKWMEILGCGVIHTQIINNLNLNIKGWAFGLGLERLAMILFNINDIRLFWTNDQRFYDQYSDEKIKHFVPYPKLQPIKKDISFWIPKNQIIIKNDNTFEWSEINSFYDNIRDVCGNMIELVSLFDSYHNKKNNKYSLSFHLLFCPETDITNPSEFNKLANNLQRNIWIMMNSLNIEMRTK